MFSAEADRSTHTHSTMQQTHCSKLILRLPLQRARKWRRELLFGTEQGLNTKRYQLIEEFDTKSLSGGVIDPLGAKNHLSEMVV